MILETLRVVRDALEDSSIGVNAQLQSIPLDSGDSVPPDVDVLEPTRDDLAARGDSGPERNVILVDVDRPARGVDGTTSQALRKANVTVSIMYAVRDGDSAEAMEDTLYTLRAVLKALADLQDDETMRTRNKVQVIHPTRIEYGEVNQDLGQGTITGLVVAEYNVRDTAP